jgi:predicted nucleotide-binding protein
MFTFFHFHSALPPWRRAIFIAHGHSSDWEKLRDFLIKKGLSVEEFASAPIAGISYYERLERMLKRSWLALIVMTSEDEGKDGKKARQNVIHEAGLSHACLRRKRTIVLLEKGCVPFSNLDGIVSIDFDAGDIEKCFPTISEILRREGLKFTFPYFRWRAIADSSVQVG